jgi:hypothetical protein
MKLAMLALLVSLPTIAYEGDGQSDAEVLDSMEEGYYQEQELVDDASGLAPERAPVPKNPQVEFAKLGVPAGPGRAPQQLEASNAGGGRSEYLPDSPEADEFGYVHYDEIDESYTNDAEIEE